MSVTLPHHIIAIGASAGGLEEINTFFDHTPSDGVSYIIVQHLSPEFTSMMAEVIARHSKLVVRQAENAMLVERNHVYTIPSDMFMSIRDGRLYLVQKELVQGPHLTINKFFISLAMDMGPKAIGVILSGLGSDGSDGVRAIKKEGGMVIARNPETSKFSSMPSNAIATGVVDFILEPELMPGTIEEFVKQEAVNLPDKEDDEKYVKSAVEIINAVSPLDFSEYKQTTILRRIKRRAALNKFINLEDYVAFLRITPAEVEALSQDFLISVTSFFRDKNAFDFLQMNVLPELIQKLIPGEELKIWVAGCATGEEAYSMAIMVSEQLPASLKHTVVKIFATDIDTAALQHAGKGIYNAGITKDVSPHLLEKYFIKEFDRYRVIPDIRKMVIFSQHDLIKNPPYCNIHLISCRNLLIYMTPALQKKVLLIFLFGLKTEGYLFLGSSENPVPIMHSLEVVNSKLKVYKNLETKRMMRFDAFSLPEIKRQLTPSPKTEVNKSHGNLLAEAVNENLVNELKSLVVCVDENNYVIKTYGDTTKFLLQKNFNLDLTALLPRPLAVAYNTLRSKALKTNEKAAVSGINIKQEDLLINTVSLSVSPMATKKGTQQMLLVTFSGDASVTGEQHTELVFDDKIYADEYILNLEDELKELKEKLQNAYAEIDISNENMQSFNEELLSANEEMQSTNEEMQSINEELNTINTDYQLKNKELLELNDDLNNYFRSNVNGQLFVNNKLELMKFSPGTVKQINLLPTDVGRPLSNISTNIKFETLLADIKQVLADGNIITREIETDNGKWYQVMTMPYVQSDYNRTGAIITFNDITELKKTQQQLDQKNRSLHRINEDLDNFVHVASHDLLAPLHNIEASIMVMNEIEVQDPELNDFLKIINSSVVKFRELVTDIGNVARTENDLLATEMIDLDEMINNIEWSLADKIKESGAVIVRNLELKYIWFSKKNFRSILYNLISNGIKFRGNAPPVLHISTAKEGENVLLTVQDNGIGLSQNQVEKIFTLYGRIRNQVEGQGVGLYLTSKIINAAGGSIHVDSEPGKGSRFTIYFTGERA